MHCASALNSVTRSTNYYQLGLRCDRMSDPQREPTSNVSTIDKPCCGLPSFSRMTAKSMSFALAGTVVTGISVAIDIGRLKHRCVGVICWPAVAMREFMSKNIKRVVSKRVEIIVGQHDAALTIKRWKRASYLSYSGGKTKGRAVRGKAFCLLGGRCCLAAHDFSTPSGVRHLTGKSLSPACAIDTAVVSRASTAKRPRIIRPIGIACR